MAAKKTPLKSMTVLSLVVLVLTLLKDKLGWDATEGELEQWAEIVLYAISAIGVYVGRSKASGPLAHKPERKKLPAILLCSVLLPSAGCAWLFPQEQFENEKARVSTQIADQYRIYTAAVRTLSALHDTGDLTQQDLQDAKPYVLQAKSALDEAHAAAVEGDLDAAKKALDVYQRAYGHLETYLLTGGSAHDSGGNSTACESGIFDRRHRAGHYRAVARRRFDYRNSGSRRARESESRSRRSDTRFSWTRRRMIAA